MPKQFIGVPGKLASNQPEIASDGTLMRA